MRLLPGRRAPWFALALSSALMSAACAGSPDGAGFVVVDPSLATRIVIVPEASTAPLEPVVIHAVGDLLAHPVLASGDTLNLDGVRTLFGDDSVTIANLACPVGLDLAPADGEAFDPRKTDCDQTLLPSLTSAGIDVLSVANDDAVLQGRRSLVATIDAINNAGMIAIGGGRNQAAAYAPTIVEVGGWRIAVLGMTAIGSNFASADQAGTAAVERTARAVAAVEAARAEADLIIATVHWGRPLDRDAERRDRDYADTLIEAGVDAIVGHGPHRLQSFALVGERPVFWSLGHLVWPVVDPADADSAVARLEVSADGHWLPACYR